ncbi:hypothetical protein [Citrobacter freundii]|uniref:hypothetical protein n=1 Tax=Citrobacter freundii TaxID=546 RepID=UPI003A9812F2
MAKFFTLGFDVVEVKGPPFNPPLRKGVKFRTPPRESEELGRFYDLVFSPEAFFASWCGRNGHYAYTSPDKPWRQAENQDGFIYLWPRTHFSLWGEYITWEMSADPEWAKQCCRVFVEINV